MSRRQQEPRRMAGPFWEIRPGEVFWSNSGGHAYRKVGDRGAALVESINGSYVNTDTDGVDMASQMFDQFDYLAGPSPRQGITSLRRLMNGTPFMVVRPENLSSWVRSTNVSLLAQYGTLFRKSAATLATCVATNGLLSSLDPLLMVYALRRLAARVCEHCHGVGFVVRTLRRQPICEPCQCLPGDHEEARWNYLLGQAGLIFETPNIDNQYRFTLPCWLPPFSPLIEADYSAAEMQVAAQAVEPDRHPLLFMGTTTGRTNSQQPHVSNTSRPPLQVALLRATFPAHATREQIAEYVRIAGTALTAAIDEFVGLELVEQLDQRTQLWSHALPVPPDPGMPQQDRTRVVQLDTPEDQTSH